MRGVRATLLLVAGLPLALVVPAIPAWAAQDIGVRTTPLNESNPAAGSGYIAWSQNSRAHPSHYDAYAKKPAHTPLRINPPGTFGWIGGIDGSLLVYQQVRKGQSDIKLFNLENRSRHDAPPGVNTKQWEWHPTISGDWILFARIRNDNRLRTLILFNRATHRSQVIDSIKGRNADIYPGQVNGDFAAWTKCTSTLCNVYRYTISTKESSRIPNPFFNEQYAASVTSAGTVYLARSGSKCGSSVRLMRYPDGGPASRLLRFPLGVDLRFTYALDTSGGAVLFHDRVKCKPDAWDVYKVNDS
jgi:hypothetical protein